MDTSQDDKLGAKLMAPLRAIVEKHRADIVPLLAGKTGDLSHAALKNDEAVRTVAIYCYALMPGLVRLAVKEPPFIDFVMSHREKVLAQLTATA